MPGKFSLRSFTDIDLSDSFFNSLKNDYQGSSKTTEFNAWFKAKAAEGRSALVFDDEEGLGAFIAIKHECERIELDEKTMPAIERMKISTFLISPRYRGQRLGEGAIGLVLWKWQDWGCDEVYVTVFETHNDLISQLEKFGFELAGHRDGECVYVKSRKRIDYSDAYKSFPFVKPNFDEAGYIAVNDYFHNTLFPYSELRRRTTPKIILDVSNGISKTYIGSSTSQLGFKAGDPVFIYSKHTGNGQPGYKSCVTTYCIVKDIVQVKQHGRALLSYEEYLARISNKSVYDPIELQNQYNNKSSLILIELVYYGFFGAGNNLNWVWLKNNGCWENSHPLMQRLTKEQFKKILKAGNLDVSNVIID
ncbi:GNAT family N-acetyltransferase [[Ruminococcus] lactaris]|uniref:GNAT family N-acetyltransferase n=1 Tax=[Ruminococcus] lactaris TaxID=46228 RepID=UPI001D036244|nr:GNAT family N-acetyltransferase [[Ruminococcus] lactaris]MCB5442401.1 GNAT family N-acetyltransferase [[Ruminococcus] lactaris]MCB5532583.1 GNAT family N-acetyltransferase [[Ruminococcus] lactaris]